MPTASNITRKEIQSILEDLEVGISKNPRDGIMHPYEPKDAQDIARKLADFLKFSEFSYVVNFTSIKRTTIEILKEEKVAYFEFSNNYKENKQLVYCSLACSICHVYLMAKHYNLIWKISITDSFETTNEIAAIYLGCGKLLLNGQGIDVKKHYPSHIKGRYDIETPISVIETPTRLNLDQLALAYVMDCQRKNYEMATILEGLKHDAKQVVSWYISGAKW